MAMPNTIVFVRHGQSEANLVQKVFKENPDAIAPEGFFDVHDSEIPLSSKGIEQAKTTGTWINQEFPDGFDRYYVSPHARTVETAGYLGINGTWVQDDLWRERDWGEYGILTPAEREEKYEVATLLKEQNKWYWGPPGGESLATGVRLRLERRLDTLHRELPEKRMIVVAHGETIDVAQFILERMTPREWIERNKDHDFDVANCQYFEYTRLEPETQKQAKLIKWFRSLNIWDPSKSWNDGEWFEINHRKYSDEELLASVSGLRRYFAEHTSEATSN